MYYKKKDVSVFLDEKSTIIIVKDQKITERIAVGTYKNSNPSPRLDIMRNYGIRLKFSHFSWILIYKTIFCC